MMIRSSLLALSLSLFACGSSQKTQSASTTAATPAKGFDCKATSGTTNIDARFDFDAMQGAVTIDGAETRRFRVRATPFAGTYVLSFLEYGEGDAKPATEALTAEKSTIVRVVTSGDDTDLYFDGDVHPAGVTGANPIRCAR